MDKKDKTWTKKGQNGGKVQKNGTNTGQNDPSLMDSDCYSKECEGMVFG